MSELQRYIRPPAPYTRFLWSGSALALALALGLAYQSLVLRREVVHTEARIAAIRKFAIQPAAVAKSSRNPDEQRQWDTLEAERNFAWSRLFAALERASNKDVQLLSFDPDKANRRVQVMGEARSQDALLGFLEALAREPALKNVHLTRQQNKKRERLDTVVFEISGRIAD